MLIVFLGEGNEDEIVNVEICGIVGKVNVELIKGYFKIWIYLRLEDRLYGKVVGVF